MADSRWAGPRKPLTNLSTPRIEPKAEKSKVSSWRRILNHLIVNQPEPLRNVSLLPGQVARMSAARISVLNPSGEEIEGSRRLKERKSTLPDIRLPPIRNLPTTLPTVSLNVYFG